MPEPAKKGKRRAFDSLINALQDNDMKVRSAAAKALGIIGDERAVNPLIEALRNHNPEFCPAAAEALGRIGDRRAVGPLADALKYKNKRMPIAALESLGVLCDTKAIAPILECIREASERFRFCRKALKTLKQINPLFMVENDKLLKRSRFLFCMRCWRRPITPYVLLSKFHGKRIVFCPKCNLPFHLQGDFKHVACEIGGEGAKAYNIDMTMYVPIWNEQEKIARYADVDSIWIRSEGVSNYHLAVNAVILALTEAMEKTEIRLEKIPVYTDPGLHLPNTVVNMLKDVFQWAPR